MKESFKDELETNEKATIRGLYGFKDQQQGIRFSQEQVLVFMTTLAFFFCSPSNSRVNIYYNFFKPCSLERLPSFHLIGLFSNEFKFIKSNYWKALLKEYEELA